MFSALSSFLLNICYYLFHSSSLCRRFFLRKLCFCICFFDSLCAYCSRYFCLEETHGLQADATSFREHRFRETERPSLLCYPRGVEGCCSVSFRSFHAKLTERFRMLATRLSKNKNKNKTKKTKQKSFCMAIFMTGNPEPVMCKFDFFLADLG